MRIFLAFLLLFTFSVFAQKPRKYFINHKGEKTTKENAKYYRVVEKKNKIRHVKDYYLNGSIQMIAQFADRKLKKQNDTVKYYHLSGNLSCIGLCLNGKKQGLWKWYYLNGKISKTGNYYQNKATGTWQWWNMDGNLLNTINNADDLLLSQYSHPPVFPGGESEFFKFLKGIKYPDKAKNQGLFGIVYTCFYLNEKGIAEDFDIISHGTSEIDSSIINRLKEMLSRRRCSIMLLHVF